MTKGRGDSIQYRARPPVATSPHGIRLTSNYISWNSPPLNPGQHCWADFGAFSMRLTRASQTCALGERSDEFDD